MRSFSFSALYPQNSVSSGECVVLRVVMRVVGSLDLFTLCVVVQVYMVITQVSGAT